EEPLGLVRAQGLEEPAGERLGAPIQLRALGAARLREPDVPYSAVPRGRLDHHEAVLFQRAQHPAQVPGVEGKASAQLAELRPFLTDLPEEARFSERTVASQEGVAEHPHALRDRTGEAATLVDGGHGIHSLILVREVAADQPYVQSRTGPGRTTSSGAH